MPLFIDLHIDSSLTPDLVTQCHVADKAIQAKYGVRYLHILLNQPQGYLFCLVEGPDKESCSKVHQNAHGNIACNIYEITQNDLSSLLSNKQKDGLDFIINHDGTLDSGNRAILSVNVLGLGENLYETNSIINSIISKSGGRLVEGFENGLTAIFESCTMAVNAGLLISDNIQNNTIRDEIRMGVDIGVPLREKGGFFEDIRKSSEYFSFISTNGQITMSSKAMQLYEGNFKSLGSRVRVIGLADEKFLNKVIECTKKIWDKGDVSVNEFARELGLSKSQLTRKLRALTNLSPNNFFREFRLRKSLFLMGSHKMNVAEITMTVGYSNPSYFTKCFRKRFGKAPSTYLTAV